MPPTTHYRDQILGLLRGQDSTAPSLFLALRIAGVEVSAPGYDRKPITFGAPAGATIANDQEVLFDEAGALWGVIDSWALMDAPTGGMAWVSDDLEEPVQIRAGEAFVARVGAITVSLPGAVAP